MAEEKQYREISDYEDMAQILAGIKGAFILSIDDRPETREIFKAFDDRPGFGDLHGQRGRV